MSQKLLSRFVKTSTYNDEIVNYQKQEQEAIERANALEELNSAKEEYYSLKHNYISYSSYNASKEYESSVYREKIQKTKKVGNWLWMVPGYTAFGAGMGVGLADMGELNKYKAYIILGSVAAATIPSLSCYIASAAYKRQAWNEEYGKPYREADRRLKKAQEKYDKAIGLTISPTAGYDWAGLSLKVSF